MAQQGGILSEREARALCDSVLRRSRTDGAAVRVESSLGGNTRFALNRITTAGDVTTTRVTVTAYAGSRRASVTVDDLRETALDEAVQRAERLAELTPEDPEHLPLLGAQDLEVIPAHFASTEGLSAAERAEAVAAVAGPAAAAGLVATGFLQREIRATALANSAGLFAYHRATGASLTTTVRGAGSGWAGATHNDWARMPDPGALAARAIEKAQRSAEPGAIDPGAYTVVLEPTAVGNLVRLVFAALDARAADEGRSAFARPGGGNRIGEQVAAPGVTLVSDPRDPDLLTAPFTEEGVAVGRTVWIEAGVLRGLGYDRYWASRQGRAATPLAGGIRMVGEQGSARDLVRDVERGLLVTRFWYIRSVDPRTLQFTGLTRDGTFLIENGAVTGAVKNLRFNQSLTAMLRHVVARGAAERVVGSESGGLGAAIVVPPLVVRDFRFTAVSDAV